MINLVVGRQRLTSLEIEKTSALNNLYSISRLSLSLATQDHLDTHHKIMVNYYVS